jgi:hypothetical protein
VKKLLEATQKAAKSTAGFMTMQLRQSALQHGWDSDVVAHLHVVHEDGKFKTHVEPEYADRAWVHEYGTEHIRPTAVLRKYSNNPKVAKEALWHSISHHYEGGK